MHALASVAPHVRPARRLRLVAPLAALLLAAAAAPALAQAPEQTPPGEGRALVTRAELEAQAARGGAEAQALRERLRVGDFRVGDRIVIRTQQSYTLPEPVLEALNDTLVVREGQVVRIAGFPDLSVAGVLRSELEERLNAHLRTQLRQGQVYAEVLVQALVSGPVGRPGYQNFAPDMLVADAMMAAGGVGGDADLRRSVIKRNGKEIVSRDSLQAAVRAGATLDRLDFRSGDELAVGERKQRNWYMIAQTAGIALSILGVVLSLTR